MRIACYARVSTEDQAIHGLSIDAQLTALREFAGEQSVGEYVDAGISARIPIKRRPEMQRLLRDVEAGKIDLVAFVKLDRWTRNIREYYKAQDILDAHNVAWKAIHEDYETQTAGGRLKVNIMLAVAQDEADRTSERVKAVFAEKRRKGLAVTAHMPLGLVVDKGIVSPGPDADKARALFERYIATRSANQVARDSLTLTGHAYSSRGLRQLLQNERYLTSGLVSPETWETVQTIMKEREQRHSRTDRIYLFSGLLICPECGMKLTVRTRIWNGKEYIYYKCDNALRIGRCSFRDSFREDDVERYLTHHILSAVSGHNVKLTKQKAKTIDTASVRRKLERLTDLYIEEKIDKEEYDRRAEPLRDAIKTAKSAPQPIDSTEIRSAMDVYPTLSKSAKKAFWSALVRTVTPSQDGFLIDLF